MDMDEREGGSVDGRTGGCARKLGGRMKRWTWTSKKGQVLMERRVGVLEREMGESQDGLI